MNNLDTGKQENRKDPVCGMDVFSANNSITSTWNDKIYYFCTQHCREEFEKSPGTYLKKKSFFLVRWWNNYLKGLNKETEGKPPKCCH